MNAENGRGRQARSPFQIPARGWKDILLRVMNEFSEDRVSLIAAGTAFYLLLAIFPALGALVSIYGFVADPSTIQGHIEALAGVVPETVLTLISDQLRSLATGERASLGFGFLAGLTFSLWTANNGMRTLFEAMNVAYEEEEKRGFFKLLLLTMAFTVGALLLIILMIVAVGVVPAVLAAVGLGSTAEALVSLLRWPILALVAGAAIALLYRVGPSREPPKWHWVTWGGTLTVLVWIVVSVLFSSYLQNFADYNATYGSIGAVIGLMMWLWISCVVLILGAELNSEIEHQTECDSTTGPDMPMGERGAVMADTVGQPARSGRG